MTIARFGVLQSVELFRQRTERLGKELQCRRVYRNFLGARFEHGALYADKIAYIKCLEARVLFLADVVALDVNLYCAFCVEYVYKRSLAHYAL